jgi:hypothetical protein
LVGVLRRDDEGEHEREAHGRRGDPSEPLQAAK